MCERFVVLVGPAIEWIGDVPDCNNSSGELIGSCFHFFVTKVLIHLNPLTLMYGREMSLNDLLPLVR